MIDASYPLTATQQGMWLHAQTQPAAGAFIEQAAFPMDTGRANIRVDVDALKRALQLVVDRHAALRSAIVARGLEPLRVVLRNMPVSFREAPTPEAAEDDDRAIDNVLAEERARGFTLNKPPLIRFVVVPRPSATWLVVTFHHVILDGWSLAVLRDEVDAAYRAIVDGVEPSLPPVASDARYASWLAARGSADAEAFWRAALVGVTAPTTIGSRTRRRTPEPATTHAQAPAHVFDVWMALAAGAAVADVAAACRVSPAVVIEWAWGVVLAARASSADVLFLATVSGRPPEIAGIDRMVGCFINTVPVRVRLEPQITVGESLRAHAEARRRQQEFEHCSAAEIHEWSPLPPGVLLGDTLLVYENVDRADAAAPVDAAGARAVGAETPYPLTLVVSPGAQTHVRVVFRERALSESLARACVAALESVLVALPSRIDDAVERALAVAAAIGVSGSVPADRSERDDDDDLEQDRTIDGPRTRLEHELSVVWARLFGRDDIGIRDDFFALGGHSLLALRLGAEIKSALGVEVPLHTLIGGATIESLAAACASHVGGNDDESLVRMGGSDTRTGPPVFCVHPLGGHVLCYTALAQRLGRVRRMWGLQAQGLAAGTTPAASWPALIDHHWALIDEATHGRAAAGGYSVIGYSFGGYIAMDIAARVQRAGGAPVAVILLDVPHVSVIPDTARHPTSAELLHALLGPSLGASIDDFRHMRADELLPRVFAMAVERRVLPPSADIDQLARALAVAAAHARLTPPAERYPLAATLIRARDGADRLTSAADLGWAAHLEALSLHWADGAHETMLDARHADPLAALIAPALN